MSEPRWGFLTRCCIVSSLIRVFSTSLSYLFRLPEVTVCCCFSCRWRERVVWTFSSLGFCVLFIFFIYSWMAYSEVMLLCITTSSCMLYMVTVASCVLVRSCLATFSVENRREEVTIALSWRDHLDASIRLSRVKAGENEVLSHIAYLLWRLMRSNALELSRLLWLRSVTSSLCVSL